MKTVVVIAVALLVAGAAGCLRATEPPRAQRVQSVSAHQLVSRGESEALFSLPPHLQATVLVTPRAIVAGTSPTVVVSLTNRGKETFILHFPTSCQLFFIVRNAEGQPVGPGITCADELSELQLQPGDTILRTFHAPWGAGLPAGRYQVFPTFVTRADPAPNGPPFTVRVVGS